MTFKDANDALIAKVPPEAMKAALDGAKDFAPDKIIAARDLEEEFIKWIFDRELSPGVEMPFEFPLRFRRGETTLWLGIEKSGKTTVLNFCTVAAMHQGERCLVASFEVPWPDTNDKFCRQAFGGLYYDKRLLKKATTDEQRENITANAKAQARTTHQWLAPNLWYYAHVGIGNWRTLMEDIRWARHRLGITWVIVDNVMRLGIAKDDYAQQALCAVQMVALCMELGIHLHIVLHQNKSEGTKGSPGGKRTASGAAEWTSNPHNIVEVQRNDKKAMRVSELWDKKKLGMIPDTEFKTELEALNALEDGKFLLRAQRNPPMDEGNDGSKMLWFLWESQQYADVPPGHAGHAPIRFVKQQQPTEDLPTHEDFPEGKG